MNYECYSNLPPTNNDWTTYDRTTFQFTVWGLGYIFYYRGKKVRCLCVLDGRNLWQGFIQIFAFLKVVLHTDIGGDLHSVRISSKSYTGFFNDNLKLSQSYTVLYLLELSSATSVSSSILKIFIDTFAFSSISFLFL